jgi:hypothetical protein
MAGAGVNQAAGRQMAIVVLDKYICQTSHKNIWFCIQIWRKNIILFIFLN